MININQLFMDQQGFSSLPLGTIEFTAEFETFR